VPIFESVIQAVWASVVPKAALAPPSAEAKRQLSCKSVNLDSSEIKSGPGKRVSECFRIDAKGRILDTQYRLVARDSVSARRDRDDSTSREKRGRELSAFRNRSERGHNAEPGWTGDFWRRAPQWDSRKDTPRWDSGQRWDNSQRWDNAPRWRDDQRDWRRADPAYIWGGRRYE
jgi:hypothetical protein